MTFLIIIGALIILYIGISFFLPSTVTIAGSLNMSGQPESIYNCIEDFNNWKDWEIWNEDNSMATNISNPPTGLGARYRWKSKIKEIKDGLIILNDAHPFNSLEYEFYYGSSKRGMIVFNIDEFENGSFVTCSITINNKRRVFGKYIAYFIKKEAITNIEDVLLKIDDQSKF